MASKSPATDSATYALSGTSVDRPLRIIPDHSSPFIPITEAAYWIATEGGNRTIDLADEPTWKSAFDHLLSRAAGGELDVFGRPNGQGSLEQIDSLRFFSIDVLLPSCSVRDAVKLQSGRDPFLQTIFHPPEGSEDSDKFFASGSGYQVEGDLLPAYSEVHVRWTDVARLWPHGAAPPIRRTGAPGRPSLAEEIVALGRQLATKDDRFSKRVSKKVLASTLIDEFKPKSNGAHLPTPKSLMATIAFQEFWRELSQSWR